MAYQAKRKQLYTADLELTEEDGTVVHVLKVEIDPDSMARKLSEKHVALVRAVQEIDSLHGQPEEDRLAVLGKAVTDLFEAVFGKGDADTIIRFYDRRYIEMCKEILPFVTGVVIPQVRKIAQENKRQVMRSYDRKPRRLFGKG